MTIVLGSSLIVAGGGGAPTDVDYLVGTADDDLSNEIVVGATPGGELGGTWATPTVDGTHSGSAHHTKYADSEAIAAVEGEATLVLSGTLTASGGGSLTGTWTDLGSVDTIDINGGTIDGAVIGATSQAAGDFTAIGAVAAGTIVGTTIDATTDFTIGATVITDGVITDAGGLQIAAVLDMANNAINNVGAAGNELLAQTWTQSGSSGNQQLIVETTGALSSDQATILLHCGASHAGDFSLQLLFREGSGDGTAGNMEYFLAYNGTSGYLKLTSEDIDGSQTRADIWRVLDGQTTIDANTTWDENVFDDYDDALVLSPYREGVFNLSKRREELIEMGILRRYPDGWVGHNDQRMEALLAGGIYQNRAHIDELTDHQDLIDKRLEELELALR